MGEEQGSKQAGKKRTVKNVPEGGGIKRAGSESRNSAAAGKNIKSTSRKRTVKKPPAKKRKRKEQDAGSWLFASTQVLLVVFVVGCIWLFFSSHYGQTIKELYREAETFVEESDRSTFTQGQTSILYDKDGNIISVIKGDKNMTYLTIDQIPQQVQEAIVSIEDKRFYKHIGFDLIALMRAAVSVVQKDKITQGGSTITQQLSRNVFLNHQVSWQRKIEEIFIAVRLERIYSKEDILEFYLNNIYFSNGYYGIEAASEGYLSKNVNELTLSETAFLCAIPNSPSLFDPKKNMNNTLKRRDKILSEMLKDKKITQTEYDEAVSEEIVMKETEIKKSGIYVESYAAYCAVRALMEKSGFVFRYDFADTAEREQYDEAYAKAYEESQADLKSGGYRIYTSLDLQMQEKLQAALDNQMEGYIGKSLEGSYTIQAAATCIDNDTGLVNAIVGGRSQSVEESALNRAYQSFRQPGSAIKPLLVYAPALERGYHADSRVADKKISDGPSNADGRYEGSMSLRRAVEKSKNTVAWSVFEDITPETGLSYLKEMCFAKIDEKDYDLPASLGGFTNGVNTVEMASGFAALENDGLFRTPTCIEKITKADGSLVLDKVGTQKQVYTKEAASEMTDILEGVLNSPSGTGRAHKLSDMPAAGKTGTTNANKDGWFVGYTGYYTTSVWVGYDIPQEMEGLTGSSFPGKIWNEFMEEIHEGLEKRELN